MIAIKDAMTKAGIDTARAELLAKATEALRAHGGDATKAVPKFSALMRKRADLLDALVLDYLRRVAANMPNVKTPTDASKSSTAARSRPSTGASGGSPDNESTPDVHVRGHKVRAHERKHPRQRQRTQAEKDAALRAASHKVEAVRSIFEARTIDNRFIGDIRWGELLTLRRVYATKAAEKLQLGTEETENALILDKIEAHVTVLDHSTKVRDAISADRLEQIIAEARAEAPRLIEYGMARYAESIEARRLGGAPL